MATASAAPLPKAAATNPDTTTMSPAAAPSAGLGTSTLPVREGESPWTKKEISAVRAELEDDLRRLQAEIEEAEADLADMLRDAGDGAGDDQADAGSKTFEREHEMSLANNTRDMLQQTEHAVARIDAGTYGACESCGQPIGKARLQAFPRATLCVSCKQREERR
jgi:RNA polymerase-binding protein DksA